jgi:ADP-heptose:LPS heptosyltransferase
MNYWKLKGVWYSKKGEDKLGNLVPDDVKSIAVIRHCALGDMVLTRKFLAEARNLFPNAKITLSIVSNYNTGIPSDLIDRLHTFEVTDENKNNVIHFIRSCRQLGSHELIFDLAITSRSIWLCKLNKAKLKIGFPYRVLYRYLFYDITVPRSDVNFEADDMLSLLKPFGLKLSYPLNFNMPGEPMKRSRDYVLYFTSASIKNKCWPAENFAELIRIMSRQYPALDHLILKGIKEWESIEEITGKLSGVKNVLPLEPASGSEELISLVKGANLVVSNDTSIRNIAITCNVPSVGIFFQTSPFRYQPQNPVHKVVYNRDLSIPPVQDVFDAATSLLESNE